MKVETIRATIQKKQPVMLEAMANGEYFYLSDEMTMSLLEFTDKSDEALNFKSINEIPLPYDEFSLEMPARRSAKEPQFGETLRRCFNFSRNKKDGTLQVTLVERLVPYPDPKMDHDIIGRLSAYEFFDIDNQAFDEKETFWKGTAAWEIGFCKEWEKEENKDLKPVFGLTAWIWHPNKKLQDQYVNLDKSFFDNEMFDREFVSGPDTAVGGILLASAISLIKTGMTKTKMSCSIIPTKKVGKKVNKTIRKHYFTTLTLDALEQVSSNQIVRRAGVSAHTVRGHFKKTKTGVFWWSPFVRGSGKVKQREAYVN